MRWFLSAHAMSRYRERVRPALDADRARVELQHVGRYATVQPDPPAWLISPEPADAWLHLGDDICFPLRRTGNKYVATTCLTHGNLTPAARSWRNRQRATRTFARVHKPRDTPRPAVPA